MGRLLIGTEDRTGLNCTTPFDEIVCSSADSGKLTYWYGKHQLFTTLSQPIFIVNLNSANDNISYPCALPPRFAALNMAMISLAEDYSLVGFKTLAVEDKTSMINLTCVINRATRYSYITPPSSNPPHGTLNDTAAPPSICANTSALFSSAVGEMKGIRSDVRDIQERWLDAFEREWRKEGEAGRARIRERKGGCWN
ncbi:uncharacterized protein LACBIDRAFT_302442 [Laccaria bicolor S238N-H82]|uniref:GPN-loop GTPase 2 n=1 Tax=Laccaria bicolor (strain S238N-H82 / ATCC MYA-4686) TaxID=486041 RepID=B0DHN1_LACBS|nr:uncharacterized protein LACBIDRAFT_302442 [Laccaria bicolor S238N-H82]EDR05863.1 predicted protein [Laccaria bicolor S238N-H82]|eukprot:XP_001883539.1 predicted protein [Laccaria bicolor S238N-H82]